MGRLRREEVRRYLQPSRLLARVNVTLTVHKKTARRRFYGLQMDGYIKLSIFAAFRACSASLHLIHEVDAGTDEKQDNAEKNNCRDANDDQHGAHKCQEAGGHGLHGPGVVIPDRIEDAQSHGVPMEELRLYTGALTIRWTRATPWASILRQSCPCRSSLGLKITDDQVQPRWRRIQPATEPRCSPLTEV